MPATVTEAEFQAGDGPTTENEYRTVSTSVDFFKKTKHQGLQFVPLNFETARRVLMTDSSFANAAGLKFQIGYVLLIVNAEERCNVLHYGITKCICIARSVMAAEVQALVHGSDYVYLVRDFVKELIGWPLTFEAIVDSKTVLNVVAKDGQSKERRLHIYVLALGHSYEEGHFLRIAWIPGTQNPADSLTILVLSTSSPWYKTMESNRFALVPQG